jgi:outer membrane protease
MTEEQTSLENESQPSCQTDVSSRFVYLITNETDMTVESAWSNFEEAKKECQQWEKMKPQKRFMVVELPINGL